MKINFSPDGLGAWVMAVAVVLFFVACKESKKESPDPVSITNPATSPADARSSDTVTVKFFDTTFCAEIIALANHYVDSIFTVIKAVPSIDKRPIRSGFGDAYMRAYRRNLQSRPGDDNTKTVFFSKEELAFYLMYAFKNNENGVQVSFARYDSIELRVDGLRDPILQDERKDKQNRNTVVVGLSTKLPLTTLSYTRPFRVAIRTDTANFYDDWHEIWP